MPDRVEACAANRAELDATLEIDRYLDDGDFADMPALLIGNGSSHVFAVIGTGAELMKFAERIKLQAQRVIDGERDRVGQYNYTAYRRTLDHPDEAAPWFKLSDEEKGRYLP